jgi:hypothetical protein
MQHADIDATSARARCQQHPHAHSSATKIMMMNKLPSAIFAIACGFLATAVHGPPGPAPRASDTDALRAPRLVRPVR